MANINLLPIEYREKQKFSVRRIVIILFFVFLAFASVYLYYSLKLEIDYKENQLKFMKTELARLEKIIKEVKNLERDKEVVEDRINVIEGLIANQSHLSRVLGEFSKSILDEVWVDNLSFNPNQTFNFNAHTFNNYLIAKYMVTLKDEPVFVNIELASIQKSKIKEEDKDVEIVNFQLSGIFINPKAEEGK